MLMQGNNYVTKLTAKSNGGYSNKKLI